MADITPIYTDGKTQISRAHDDSLDETFYVATFYGEITLAQLVALEGYIPGEAYLDDYEEQGDVTSLQFVVPA